MQMKFTKRNAPLPATTIVLILLSFFARHLEAGGKGKVPVYMPIPIPIPMPIGPPGGGGGGPKFHHRPSENSAHDDDGGDVKKIYLLQPIQRPMPQPNLKGGGFMGGPVQNHIHVQPAQPPPASHKHFNGGGGRPRGGATNLDGDAGDFHGAKYHSKSEVKILPIVVIPPIAPMPPLQVSGGGYSHAAPKMTLQPQFNNYMVAPSGRKQRMVETGGGGGNGYHNSGGDSDGDNGSYGGSVGGSTFRDNYAARIRPAQSGRLRRHQQLAASNEYAQQVWLQSAPVRRQQSRYRVDYDDDFDYDSPPPQPPRDSFRRVATRTAGWLRTPQPRQHYQRGGGSGHAHLEAGRVNSIRDIVEAGGGGGAGRAQEEGGASNLFGAADYDETSSSTWPSAASLATKLRRQPGAYLSQQPFEISLDNIMSSNTDTASVAAPATGEEFNAAGQQQPQDLSATYYDSFPRARPAGGAASGLTFSPRDPFDENGDEWRFETIKSVVHLDSNSNNTVKATPQTSAADSKTLTTSGGERLEPNSGKSHPPAAPTKTPTPPTASKAPI